MPNYMVSSEWIDNDDLLWTDNDDAPYGLWSPYLVYLVNIYTADTLDYLFEVEKRP